MARIETSTIPSGLPIHRIELPGTRATTVLVAFDAGARTERREVMDRYIEHVLSFVDEQSITPFNVVLDAGSGVAGLSAAVQAATAEDGVRVGVLSKADLHQATTRWAQGGVAAVRVDGFWGFALPTAFGTVGLALLAWLLGLSRVAAGLLREIEELSGTERLIRFGQWESAAIDALCPEFDDIVDPLTAALPELPTVPMISPADPIYREYERFREEFGGTRTLIVAIKAPYSSACSWTWGWARCRGSRSG